MKLIIKDRGMGKTTQLIHIFVPRRIVDDDEE